MKNEKLPKVITVGDKYKPAMEIVDQSKADAYFEKCVAHQMEFGYSRDEAVSIELKNLGYFAGYYSADVQDRVRRLYHSPHPIL